MLYFPLHIGDWMTGTKLMSTLEKGVYIDLLVYYYSVERPISEDECKRIARAYANAEQEAMQYVLQNHFVHEGGVYRHEKCDEVIAQTKEKQTDISEKRRNAAKARWNKERKQAIDGENKKETDADPVQLDMQMQCKCRADEMLSNNHKPITKNINNTNKQHTQVCNEGSAVEDGVCSDCFDEGSFDPDEVIDAPIKVQAAQAQLEHFDSVADDQPLSLAQLITGCKQLGIKLSHTTKTEAIASRETITKEVLRECAKAWKGTNTGTGYFVGILENASKDVNTVMPREKRELGPDTITDKQASFFASKLVRDSGFCSKFGKGYQDYNVFASKVAANIRNPRHFDEYKPYMERIGLLGGEQ